MSVRWTAGHLLSRRIRTRPAASVLVGVLALLTVLVAAVAPRLVERQATAELSYQLTAVGSVGRSLQGAATFPEPWSPVPPPDLGQIYGGLQSSFEQARRDFPRPLRDMVGAPQWIVQTPTLRSAQVDGAPRLMGLRLTADRDYLSKIRIVSGSAPATWSTNDAQPAEDTADVPVEVVLSVRAAAQLKLRVGSVVGTDLVEGVPQRVYRVTGLFEARSAADDFWKQNPSLLPVSTGLTEQGAQFPVAAAFVAPLTVGRIGQTFGDARISLSYPLRASGVDGADAELLRSQLAAAVATGIPLPNSDTSMSIVTRSDQAVQTAVERGALLSGLLALLAAAPLGVVLAVLVLGVQVVMQGRRQDLLLASSRGASGWQLRGAMAVEGALVSVPTAVVVTVLAAILIPVRAEPASFLLPALVAAAPPVLFAALAVTQDSPGLFGRLLGGLRPVAEVAVILLAALSVFLLARRGLAQAAAAVGVDPLLAVAPLLLATAVGVVVLRGYPLPMRLVRRAAIRGRSLPAFIGAIRATRAPTIGLAGVLALVVGISVSLFSVVLLSTFNAGIERAAAESVGADARADSPAFTPAQRDAVAAVDGVRSVAGIQYLSSLDVSKSPVTDSVTVLLAQTGPLSTLRDLPAGLTAEAGGRVPVVVSSDLLKVVGAKRTAIIDGVEVRIVAGLPADSQLGPADDWVIVDSSFAARFSTSFAPETLLIRADPAKLPGLQRPLERAVGAGTAESTATIVTVPTATADRQHEPVVGGVRVGVLVGALLAVLLCAVALVLSTVAAGALRGRTAGILRTLGMPRRRIRTLIAWELVPVALVALIAGTALGLLLPDVVTAAVDLRAFTGGLARPVPVLDPLALGGVLAAFSLVVLAAALIAIAVGDRVNPSTTLKMGSS